MELFGEPRFWYIPRMNRIAELASCLDEEKAQRARDTSMEEKLLDGPRLFRTACEQMRAGIRLTHPGASEEQIERILWDRNYEHLPQCH